MPILTTTYPVINSTFNVGQHTLRLIQEKMSHAALLCDQILEGGHMTWENLFKVGVYGNRFWLKTFCAKDSKFPLVLLIHSTKLLILPLSSYYSDLSHNLDLIA